MPRLLTAIVSLFRPRPVTTGGTEAPPEPAGFPPARITMLVVTRTYESALVVAPFLDAAGAVPTFLPSAEIEATETRPAQAGVLVLREVETADKLRVCDHLRRSESFAGIPIVVMTTWVEGRLAPNADAVIRPPGSLRDAVMELRSLVT